MGQLFRSNVISIGKYMFSAVRRGKASSKVNSLSGRAVCTRGAGNSGEQA